jgi:predicted transcriptional regulator
VLEHFTRGRIYEYIRNNPGVNYTTIKKSLELTNGTLTHHLNYLKGQDFIKFKNDGMYKRFYVKGIKIPDNGSKFNETQLKILGLITKRPGITQIEISKILKISDSTVSYNIKLLVNAGAVRIEKVWRSTKCYLRED